jgi:glycosyltransferase involved in cell wall biosynthesis
LREKDIKYAYWLERPFPASGIKQFIKDIIYSYIFGKADFLITIGKMANIIYSKYNNNRINIPYSRRVSEFLESDIVNPIIRFLFIGQLIERKNIKNLIQAFNKITYENVALEICGAGPLEGYVKDVALNNDKIKFSGFLQNKELNSTLARSDVLVFPSNYDGWALVITEAMASGLGIIVGENVGAGVEYIINNYNGFICNSKIESILECLNKYCENLQLSKKHGKINRSIINVSEGNSKVAAKSLIAYLNENGIK